jgi:Kef-type K+ transport system membrane component KefB
VLVAGGSEAATLFGLDGIVGAFMAGIAARRAIGREEPTHVLKVVSNTFLIPAFFMATGMLIQPSVLLDTLQHQPLLALGLTAALVAAEPVPIAPLPGAAGEPT